MTNRLKENRARRADPAGEERWLWALAGAVLVMIIWGTLWAAARLLGTTQASPGAYPAELTRGGRVSAPRRSSRPSWSSCWWPAQSWWASGSSAP